MNLSDLKATLFDLCGCSGISGDERSVAKYCADFLSEYAEISVEIDDFNNVIAVFGSENAEKTFLLDAHIDQIGFIVTDIDENGFLSVDKVGGVDLRTALDAPVVVHGTKDLKGIICCMPPHLSDGNEDKAVTIDKVYIDLGLPVDEVKNSVSVGDSVTFFASPKELLNNRVTAAALDNRAGVCTLLRVAQLISTNKHIYSDNPNVYKFNPYKVVMVLSCQEETFATGAKTVPFNYDVDECICVDVSFASQPGVDDQYSNIKLGKGAMLCISPNLNREMYNRLKELADNLGYEYQTEVCSGKTGTNADSIVVSKSGVKTAVVSIPEKNMHTQAEIISLDDIEETAKLINVYIINGGVK